MEVIAVIQTVDFLGTETVMISLKEDLFINTID